MSLIWPILIAYNILFSHKLPSLAAPTSLEGATNSDNDTDNQYDENSYILRKCLMRDNSKISLNDIHTLENFDNWYDTEKLPCFSRCLSVKKGWFNTTTRQWNGTQLSKDLSENVYKYCEHLLLEDRGDNANDDQNCHLVYRGFKCLREAAYRTIETYLTLITCAIELRATPEQLKKYEQFQTPEEVPCLFKCFANKFHFYTKDYEWNFDNWIKALGPFDTTITPNIDYTACRSNATKRVQVEEECSWMYQEYLCLRNFNNRSNLKITTTPIAITTDIIKDGFSKENYMKKVTNFITENNIISE